MKMQSAPKGKIMINDLKSAVKETIKIINEILKKNGTVKVAIDGKCGSGKSTFAELLSKEFDCNLFHMDDFYLTPEKRTQKRLNEPGGNVDRERFLAEALIPAINEKDVFYKVYNCATKTFKEPVKITPKNVTITEGSYSCHPELFRFYDLHIFLTVSPETQMDRIINRNGKEDAENFKNKWIPMEEKYFEHFKIAEKCDIIFKTE